MKSKQFSTTLSALCLIAFFAIVAAQCAFGQGYTPYGIPETKPTPENKIYDFKLPVKKWVAPVVKITAFAGAFAGGVCWGKGEWELADHGWPRSESSHWWRDAGNWTVGGSCGLYGAGIVLDGKVTWKECLFNGLGMGLSSWLGTRVGYYKMRKR
jgi:hypothetical protein